MQIYWQTMCLVRNRKYSLELNLVNMVRIKAIRSVLHGVNPQQLITFVWVYWRRQMWTFGFNGVLQLLQLCCILSGDCFDFLKDCLIIPHRYHDFSRLSNSLFFLLLSSSSVSTHSLDWIHGSSTAMKRCAQLSCV